jgi:hypothetical protein
MTHKTLHRKLEIEQHEPHKTRGEIISPERVSSSNSINDTRPFTLDKNPVTSHEREHEEEIR